MSSLAWLTRTVLLTQTVAILATLVAVPSFQSQAPRENHLAVLGYLLPASTWDTPSVWSAAVAVFLVGMVLWMASPLQRTGAVSGLLGLLVLGSWRVQNEFYATHQLFAPFAVLAIFGTATLAYGTVAVPRKTFRHAVMLLGFGYTMAGLEKLWANGFSWADGTALRLWLSVPWVDDSVAHWLSEQPFLAATGQTVVLFAETFAIVGLAFRSTRLPWGAVLLAFHLCLEWWMGLAFYGNEMALIVLCGVWPISEGWPKRFRRGQRAQTELVVRGVS